MKKTADPSARSKSRRPVLPPAIKKGDTIGIVAPAGPIINKGRFAAGIRILEKRGFRVKYNPLLLHAKGYLAGSDRERADEFNRLWSDPEVSALVAARGGYGCLRILDLIDMKQIRRNPKILIGFSDLTGLVAAINGKTGLVTYHGPVVTTLASIDKKSLAGFFKTLAGRTPERIKPAGIRILNAGRAKGILRGGNLTTLVHMIGTPYEFSWDKTILFMEDTGESPYRLDRLLTHLGKAGRLQKIRGLILGAFTDENNKERPTLQKAVQVRISELLADRNIPVWANFPVGHAKRNLTLPIGVETDMDSASATLSIRQF